MPGHVLRQVSTTENRVVFGVIDVSTGIAYKYEMTWDKLEEFVRTHGDQAPAGEVIRKMSHELRDGMESGGPDGT